VTPGLDIGPLYIRYYGVIIMIGALAGGWLATRLARRRGLNTELVWDAFLYVLIGGILGARLWHILLPSESDAAKGLTTLFYLTHPLDALAIWKGGLGIPGAVIGGALLLYLYCRRAKLSFSTWADVAAPALALGQAIGRWGNFVNQELYGMPSDLPWAIRIDPIHRLPEFINVERYHPLFLYESLWNFLNMGLLLWLDRRPSKWLKDGDLFLIYLVTYPVGRFLLEFLRLDVARVAGINANQTIMLVIALLFAMVFIWRHRTDFAPQTVTEDSQKPQVHD
jgi:phosphatidylglycerol---prolipoprotein diacylglyceryl transferase